MVNLMDFPYQQCMKFGLVSYHDPCNGRLGLPGDS